MLIFSCVVVFFLVCWSRTTHSYLRMKSSGDWYRKPRWVSSKKMCISTHHLALTWIRAVVVADGELSSWELAPPYTPSLTHCQKLKRVLLYDTSTHRRSPSLLQTACFLPVDNCLGLLTESLTEIRISGLQRASPVPCLLCDRFILHCHFTGILCSSAILNQKTTCL